jgi:hypothetical protein
MDRVYAPVIDLLVDREVIAAAANARHGIIRSFVLDSRAARA